MHLPHGQEGKLRRLAVAGRAEAVNMVQITHVVAMQMSNEDLVHPAIPDVHGVVIGTHTGATVENEVIQRHLLLLVPPHLDEDAPHLLGLSHRWNGRAHEGDAHLVFVQRRNGGLGRRAEWI